MRSASRRSCCPALALPSTAMRDRYAMCARTPALHTAQISGWTPATTPMDRWLCRYLNLWMPQMPRRCLRQSPLNRSGDWHASVYIERESTAPHVHQRMLHKDHRLWAGVHLSMVPPLQLVLGVCCACCQAACSCSGYRQHQAARNEQDPSKLSHGKSMSLGDRFRDGCSVTLTSMRARAHPCSEQSDAQRVFRGLDAILQLTYGVNWAAKIVRCGDSMRRTRRVYACRPADPSRFWTSG